MNSWCAGRTMHCMVQLFLEASGRCCDTMPVQTKLTI